MERKPYCSACKRRLESCW